MTLHHVVQLEHQHVVQLSGGAGSWMASRRVIERHGREQVTLLFADVRGNARHEHAGEDEDLYRFLGDIQQSLGVRITRIADGRDIWQLFFDRRFIGNSQTDLCSETLKRNLLWGYMGRRFDPANTTTYLGIDWTEAHRLDRTRTRRPEWQIEAPLCEPPYLDKDEILRALVGEGIQPPRLYGLGFAHNNCGGFCVKAGMAQHKQLLQVLPDRFAYHERREQEFREFIGRDVAIVRDRSLKGILEHQGLARDGVERDGRWWRVRATGEPLPRSVPLPLAELRRRVYAGTDDTDPNDVGGCGCALD